MRRRGRRRKQLLGDLKKKTWIREIYGGSTSLHCVLNWLLKRLWTYRQADDKANE